MAKEVLLYGEINEQSAAQFIKDCNVASELAPLQETTVRINTQGGEVSYGYGMVKKISEMENKKIMVDGDCYSMGAVALLHCSDVVAVDTARFMLHRAGYSQWFESSDYFTDALKKNTEEMNADIEKAFRRKIDVDAFEEIADMKVKKLFSMESNPEKDMVFLSAKEAKKIGLIDKVVPLSENIKAFVNAKMVNKNHGNIYPEKLLTKFKVAANGNEPTETKKTMTAQELQAQFPAVYNEIFNSGKDAGIASERDRVGAALVFNHLDPEGVKAIIASGKPMTATQQAEFALKAMSPKSADELAAGATASSKTATVPADEGKHEKVNPEVATFLANVRSGLGLKAQSNKEIGIEAGVRKMA